MTDKKIVAIHQPNFFPWLGYFNKIIKADLFLVLDNVQFPKKGGTWCNRVKLIMGGKADWVTMPVVRSYHGVRLIQDMKIDNTIPWRVKLLKTIQTNYSRAPFLDFIFPFIEAIINNPTESLSEYNFAAIRSIVEVLQLDPEKLIKGSKLSASGNATDLLISMVKAVDGTAYLCGGGASGYQEDEKFAEAGIGLVYQNFQHPIYPQFNTDEFIPGLSIIDALMNSGFEGTKKLILSV